MLGLARRHRLLVRGCQRGHLLLARRLRLPVRQLELVPLRLARRRRLLVRCSLLAQCLLARSRRRTRSHLQFVARLLELVNLHPQLPLHRRRGLRRRRRRRLQLRDPLRLLRRRSRRSHLGRLDLSTERGDLSAQLLALPLSVR